MAKLIDSMVAPRHAKLSARADCSCFTHSMFWAFIFRVVCSCLYYSMVLLGVVSSSISTYRPLTSRSLRLEKAKSSRGLCSTWHMRLCLLVVFVPSFNSWNIWARLDDRHGAGFVVLRRRIIDHCVSDCVISPLVFLSQLLSTRPQVTLSACLILSKLHLHERLSVGNTSIGGKAD